MLTSRARNKVKKVSISRYQAQTYDLRNSSVLRLRLNDANDEDDVTCDGRLFHAWAAATGNARPPSVFRWKRGTTSLAIEVDRRFKGARIVHEQQIESNHTVFRTLANKIVSRSLLNVQMLRDAVSLTVNGRLFQSVEPDTEKLCGPERTDRVLGISFSRTRNAVCFSRKGSQDVASRRGKSAQLFRLHLWTSCPARQKNRMIPRGTRICHWYLWAQKLNIHISYHMVRYTGILFWIIFGKASLGIW